MQKVKMRDGCSQNDCTARAHTSVFIIAELHVGIACARRFVTLGPPRSSPATTDPGRNGRMLCQCFLLQSENEATLASVGLGQTHWPKNLANAQKQFALQSQLIWSLPVLLSGPAAFCLGAARETEWVMRGPPPILLLHSLRLSESAGCTDGTSMYILFFLEVVSHRCACTIVHGSWFSN